MSVLKKLNLVGKESEKMWLQRGKYQHNLHLLMGEEMRKPSKKKKIKELFKKAFKEKQGLRKFGEE